MAIQLSERLGVTEFPPIAEALSWVANRQGNREFINMCQAVPSYPPALELQQEFARLAGQPGTGGYTEILGIPELRQAFAGFISQTYGAKVGASEIGITTGCNQAFAAAVMAVAKAGDNVIVPSPWYFNHNMWLTMLGIETKAISAFCSGGDWPAVDTARAAIDDKTRAIVLVTPNNPTGAVYPPNVIAEFHALAIEKSIALIIDETYQDFREEKTAAHALLENQKGRENLVQLFSFSKIYALAGYRLGAMVTGPAIMREATKVLDTMTICPPHISQRGVVFALENLDQWKETKKAVMAERLAAIRQAFQTHGLKYELVSSGAYFAYVKHPFRGKASKAVAQRLAQQHDVLCLPGSMFGPGQDDFLRFAFANVEKAKMPMLAERLLSSQASMF